MKTDVMKDRQAQRQALRPVLRAIGMTDAEFDRLVFRAKTIRENRLRKGLIRQTRQMQIFRMIGRGIPKHQIIRKLGMKMETLWTHQARICHKLGIKAVDLPRAWLAFQLAESTTG